MIFIGLCIKTGALLYSFFVSHFINPVAAKNLHLGLDLSDLYHHSVPHYSALVSLMILLSALKAYIFYLVIKIFLKTNLVHPFSTPVASLISGISYVAFIIGILTVAGNYYVDWLTLRGINFPPMQEYMGADGEYLFFAGVIFFIAQVFKTGIEIQTENELTV